MADQNCKSSRPFGWWSVLIDSSSLYRINVAGIFTGLDVNTGFICRRTCFKRLQDIKAKLQKMTGNVIQSVALDTQASTSQIKTSTGNQASPKIVSKSHIKTAAGKRIVLVTVKKDEDSEASRMVSSIS